MRVFETVARLQSVSRASEAVHLSQPAISQAVANLESQCGVRLLERHHAGSVPTEYGEILLFRIRRMNHLMVQAVSEFFASVAAGPRPAAETLLGRITVTQLRGLIAVSENVSFDQAARSIGISEPSLHRSARDLETLLRRPLYVRGSRGATTTKEGSLLARRFNLALTEIRYGFEEIRHRKGIVDSSILVGTLSTSGAPLLSRAIDKLLATYPALRIRIIEAPYDHLLKDLLLGNVDFLFSVLRRPEWATEVVEETLYRDDYVVVARPAHPLHKTRSVSRRQLTRYNWVIPGTTTPRYRAFRTLFGSQSPVADIITESRAITRALVAGSDRLTILTRHEAESERDLGVMAILPFECNIPAPAYGVATRMNWAATAIHQQLLEILRTLSRAALAGR